MEVKFVFFRNLIVNVKNDITGIIKEVKRIMVIYQFRVLRDIKLKGYMLL